MSIIAWASSWRLEPTNSNFIKERDIKMSGQKKINNNNKKQKKTQKTNPALSIQPRCLSHSKGWF